MFVKMRIHYLFEEKFIFGIECPLPGLEKGEWPAKEGIYWILFAKYHNLNQWHKPRSPPPLFEHLPLSHNFLIMIQEFNLELKILSFLKKIFFTVNFWKRISDKSLYHQETIKSYSIHKRFIFVKLLAFENLSVFLGRFCHGQFQKSSI